MILEDKKKGFLNEGIKIFSYIYRLDFEVKLRKLNDLMKDGLINEEEFKRKREEILSEKW
ncbi:SHOCT domain-containing protein [Tepidibacter formicigenes]|uniref:SHOCT domain-containing protein n=1 Tax=Tepidibacter formicigenes TaxID=227138 RepID=UPI000A035C48|nr:SHOCT domain-containing protein [Tepidibacter formicigenes]